MRLNKFKYCFIVVSYLLFYNISHTYSQCNIELLKQQKDTFIFRRADITDSLQCYVHVYLTYSKVHAKGGEGWSKKGIEIRDIEIRTKSNNQKLKVFDCSDTLHQCICDTLGKYVRLYYNDPNRLATAFELTTLDKYSTYQGSVKIGLTFSSIYIYPYKKIKRKN